MAEPEPSTPPPAAQAPPAPEQIRPMPAEVMNWEKKAQDSPRERPTPPAGGATRPGERP
jgi:hypothetical protein